MDTRRKMIKQYPTLSQGGITILLSKIIFIIMVTLTFDIMTPKLTGFFPFYRRIMWPSCGNDPVVKNSIYSNGDL